MYCNLHVLVFFTAMYTIKAGNDDRNLRKAQSHVTVWSETLCMLSSVSTQ